MNWERAYWAGCAMALLVGALIPKDMRGLSGISVIAGMWLCVFLALRPHKQDPTPPTEDKP